MRVDGGGVDAIAKYCTLWNRQAATVEIGCSAISYKDHVAATGIHCSSEAVVVTVVAAGIGAHTADQPCIISVGILGYLGAFLDANFADSYIDFTLHRKAALS